MSLAERFAQEAEGLVGTRFVEHGRDPAVGLDCVGMALVAARRAGVEFPDRPYVLGLGVDLWTPMVEVVETRADRLPDGEEWRRGDVLGFRFGPMRNHLGVYLGRTLVAHASDRTGIMRTIVTPLDPAHRRTVAAAWRLREAA